jgi:hypothetical protein
LVRAFVVVVGDVLVAQMVEMLLAEDREPIEAFLPDRLDEAFHEGVRIRCSVAITTLFIYPALFYALLRSTWVTVSQGGVR